MDINELLDEAENGKRTAILSRITDEAKPFWDGLEDRVKAGRPVKPFVVSRLLKQHYNIKISETAVRHHFQNIVDANVKES
tara:strand:- start:5365 stop:5607 length:243 start_codon:yes stop_codon:yes gene_type:complete